MKYQDMSCNELRRRMNQIDNDLRRFQTMSAAEKSRLTYERSQIEHVLIKKLTAILDEEE
jgi:archaellum component FlaC